MNWGVIHFSVKAHVLSRAKQRREGCKQRIFKVKQNLKKKKKVGTYSEEEQPRMLRHCKEEIKVLV